MLTIKLSRRADKMLTGIPAKHARQIAERISLLAQEPSALPSVELKGYTPWRRAKSGEYRIIFHVDGRDLNIGILGILGKRNDDEVYRLIERFLR